MNEPNELMVLEDFINILEDLGITYAISGSMASSVYGKVRFTQDTDIAVEAFGNVAEEFFEKLKIKYYVSKDAMCQALREGSSFNIIHFESALKIDVFVCKGTAFEKQLMSRRRALKLSSAFEREFSVVSSEDIILLKLCWYRDGGYSSHRQWEDVLGVMETQTDKLDMEYLKQWSIMLEINELLEKAISEAG